MHRNIYKTDVQNLLLHVSTLLGYHHEEFFTEVTAVFSKLYASRPACDCAEYNGQFPKHCLNTMRNS